MQYCAAVKKRNLFSSPWPLTRVCVSIFLVVTDGRAQTGWSTASRASHSVRRCVAVCPRTGRDHSELRWDCFPSSRFCHADCAAPLKLSVDRETCVGPRWQRQRSVGVSRATWITSRKRAPAHLQRPLINTGFLPRTEQPRFFCCDLKKKNDYIIYFH